MTMPVSEFALLCQIFKIPLNGPAGGYVPLSGGTMTGDLILNGPASQNLQAVTYMQLQDAIAGITTKQSVIAASTANIAGTYNNGASGVGATFTVTATGVLVLDGVTITVGQRVLLKNQTLGYENGIYVATNPGSLGVSPILTRATDYNVPSEVTAINLIPIVFGTTLGGTMWLQNATITTIGTDYLVYGQYSSGSMTFTGDVTGSGFSPIALTLATVNSNVGTFASASQTGQFTVDGKGRITAATNVSIQIAQSQVTGLEAYLTAIVDELDLKALDSAVVHNTGDETIAGVKTFNSTIVGNISGNAGSASTVSIAGEDADTTCFLLFVTASGAQVLQPKTHADLQYNPVTNVIAANLNGNATSASSVSMANETSDTTCFPIFSTASGTQTSQPKTNTNWTYDSAANRMTMTGFTVIKNGSITVSDFVQFGDTSATTDSKYWGMGPNGLSFYGYTLNDAKNSSVNWIQVTRSSGSASISSVSFPNGNVNISSLTASRAVVTDGSKNLTSLQYTDANTASTLVQRDSSGNFTASTITAALTGAATQIGTTANTSNSNFYIPFFASSSTSNQAAQIDAGLSFNPSTNGKFLTITTAATTNNCGINVNATGVGCEPQLNLNRKSTASASHVWFQTDGSSKYGMGLQNGSTNFEIYDNTGSLRIFGSATNGSNPENYFSGRVQILNTDGDPSTPTGGPKMYAVSGAAKVIGTSGTITTYGPADPHCPDCGSDFGWEWDNPLYGGNLQFCAACFVNEFEKLTGTKTFIRRKESNRKLPLVRDEHPWKELQLQQ